MVAEGKNYDGYLVDDKGALKYYGKKLRYNTSSMYAEDAFVMWQVRVSRACRTPSAAMVR